ncbi:MAG: condensation domain-containing protein, partial [Blastocatellia bacterium]
MKDFTDRLSSLTPEQRALFESRLKKRPANRPQTGASKAGSIPKRKRLNNCLLSFDQERIWIIDQMEPGNPAYNIYSASRLLGPLSREAWKRAINEMVRRYEILRTTFSTIDGEPVMVILPELTIDVAFEDASHFPPNRRLVETVRMINEATAQPFDLTKGPLLRVGFIKLDEEDHAVHLTMH